MTIPTSRKRKADSPPAEEPQQKRVMRELDEEEFTRELDQELHALFQADLERSARPNDGRQELDEEEFTRELDQELRALFEADQGIDSGLDDGCDDLRSRYVSHSRIDHGERDGPDEPEIYVSPLAEADEEYDEDIILSGPREYPVGPSVVPCRHPRVEELSWQSNRRKPDPHSPFVFPRSGQLPRRAAAENDETLFLDWRVQMGISKFWCKKIVVMEPPMKQKFKPSPLRMEWRVEEEEF
jgi:hypothetical protein